MKIIWKRFTYLKPHQSNDLLEDAVAFLSPLGPIPLGLKGLFSLISARFFNSNLLTGGWLNSLLLLITRDGFSKILTPSLACLVRASKYLPTIFT